MSLANQEGYATRSVKCDYCKSPFRAFLSLGRDLSNPRQPDLNHPDCKLVGRYIIERVDRDRDHGLLMHMAPEFEQHYTYGTYLYFADDGFFFRIPQRNNVPLCNEM